MCRDWVLVDLAVTWKMRAKKSLVLDFSSDELFSHPRTFSLFRASTNFPWVSEPREFEISMCLLY